jgi:hypothetical protein
MSDRLSPDVRLIFFSLLGGLLLYGLPLYFFPADTAFFWAWVIPQPRSALLLGALYLAGALYYVLALRTDSWQAVQNNIPTLFLFCVVLLGAAMIHWDSLRPYHPMSLLWLTSYYAALLFLPILPWMQKASMGGISEAGTRLAPGWRIWLVVRGAVYLVMALFGFVLAPTLSTLWPWSIETMDLRMFMGQPAAIGIVSGLALRSDLLQVHRLGLIFTSIVGGLQLVGMLVNSTPYNGPTLVGILLPLVFGEWLLTPLLLFITTKKR